MIRLEEKPFTAWQIRDADGQDSWRELKPPSVSRSDYDRAIHQQFPKGYAEQ